MVAPIVAAAMVTGAAQLLGNVMNNSASSSEASKNRSFQEYMSNTAHQREVADLKAAGLNPILSATNGQGASTGTGSQADLSSIMDGVSETLGTGVSNALQKKQLDMQKQQAEKQYELDKEKNDAEISNLESQTAKNYSDIDTSTQMLPSNLEVNSSRAFQQRMRGKQSEAQIDLMKQQTIAQQWQNMVSSVVTPVFEENKDGLVTGLRNFVEEGIDYIKSMPERISSAWQMTKGEFTSVIDDVTKEAKEIINDATDVKQDEPEPGFWERVRRFIQKYHWFFGPIPYFLTKPKVIERKK